MYVFIKCLDSTSAMYGLWLKSAAVLKYDYQLIKPNKMTHNQISSMVSITPKQQNVKEVKVSTNDTTCLLNWGKLPGILNDKIRAKR